MFVRAVAQLGGRWPFDREVQGSNSTVGNCQKDGQNLAGVN